MTLLHQINSIERSRNVWVMSENEGRVLLQHKVCISVACEMCCPIWAAIALMKYGCEKYGKNNVS